MLATQMHERYVVPAAALLAVAAGGGGRRWFWAVMLPATANLAIALRYENATTGRAGVTTADLAPYQPWLLAVSVVNVAVLVAATAAYARGAFGPRRGDDAGPMTARAGVPQTRAG